MYEMRAHPQILRNCIYRMLALLLHRAPLGSRLKLDAAKKALDEYGQLITEKRDEFI